MDPFGRPFYSHMAPPIDPRMHQIERAFPTTCAADVLEAFARMVFSWPDLFESTARLIENRLRTSFDEVKLAALYTLDFLVKRVHDGGRPFARIFACLLPLRDIVLQFYRDVLLRQAQYPQSRDLASKMDKTYQVWWEYLQAFLETRGAPFIDSPVLWDIATHCAIVRPQLQAIAHEFSRKIQTRQNPAVVPRPPPPANPPPNVDQQAQRIQMFCDKLSRLFASDLSLSTKDVKFCLVSYLQKQEKAVQSKLLGEINLHSDQDWNETHKNRLKPIWDIINSLYAPAPSLARLYNDAQGVRPCEMCGCRFDPAEMRLHVQRHRREEHETFSKTRPWFLKRDDFEAGGDMKQSRVAASEAGGGSKVSPASPVATTPKIALDKSVHVRELKCAVCGGPFTDTHIETTNGQSFLVHAVRWNDDAASPRSPTDDGLQSSDGGVAGPQFAHSSCDRDLRGA